MYRSCESYTGIEYGTTLVLCAFFMLAVFGPMVNIDATGIRRQHHHHQNALRSPERLYGSQPTSPLRKLRTWYHGWTNRSIDYSNQRAQQKFKIKNQLGVE